ncbi:MAG TPA: lactate racemase domain-containing protein [Sedimentisphaerales bacterium]|nr:lactate racemase domain-containing protein [Sedimentisphaerales bacterium]HRS09999.1 lactate racemase domain-containing protein [Sedimentisphaerales bacterium]HRV46705.1 lactate racemase domain-containing protein [Sedimentisphaerales bacterium]
MLYYRRGRESDHLSAEDLRQGLFEALDKLGRRRKVLALPPDITRFHSRAGELTRYAWQYYGKALTDILLAVGTHSPMTVAQIRKMFGEVPLDLFREHDWRGGLVTLGEVPGEFVKEVSEGKLDFSWPAQVDKLLVEGGFDLILSIGQVVPHEVVGMANYNKNVFVGTGGVEAINKSHYLGAVYGMERMMGRADTPVRRVLNYASDYFAKDMPIVYVLTVVAATESGQVARGLFIGDDIECFNCAAELSLKVNFQMLDEPLQKAVVYLEPQEFKSTWLGNKSIYRTRMAMADGGELIVLAPGLREFGEDKEIDRLIRKYGYVGTDRVLQLVAENEDLRANLSAAAHLIHGSTEGRFRVTYCPGHLTREQIESVNFRYADLGRMMAKYDPKKLKDGFNTVDGETIFYISNPALGLWSTKARFQ